MYQNLVHFSQSNSSVFKKITSQNYNKMFYHHFRLLTPSLYIKVKFEEES